MATVNCFSTTKNPNAFTVLLEEINGKVADVVEQTARTMLEVATERTPKYSGQATRGWRVTMKKDSIEAAAWDGKVERRERYGPPKYEGGMWDPSAGGLNREVVNRHVQLTKHNIIRKLSQTHDVTLYLYNKEPYTALWLNDADYGTNLREVNQEFWTMEEIKSALYQRLVGLRMY